MQSLAALQPSFVQMCEMAGFDAAPSTMPEELPGVCTWLIVSTDG